MNRRILLGAAILVTGMVLTLSRCDPRQSGVAAPAGVDRRDGRITRTDLRFACGDSQCAAWLYLPESGSPPPVVVMGHGFAGTRDVGLPGMAERLASAGLAVLVFDYRYFGASGGLPRQLVDPSCQLEDWRAALRFARARPEVDGRRAALFGSSLGGGHALIVGAVEPNLCAIVAQAPLLDSSSEGEAASHGAGSVVRLLLLGWADMALSSIGGDPIRFPAIAPSSGFGMIVDDSAYAAFEKLAPAESTYRNAVAARSLFLFDDYDPAPVAGEIHVPVLLVASRRDRFAPYSAVEAFAQRVPTVEIATFDGDHFDVYSPPASVQAGNAAAAFLRRSCGLDSAG